MPQLWSPDPLFPWLRQRR